MPAYPFRCEACGFDEDVFLPMKEMRPNLVLFCYKCGGTRHRYYTPPIDLSENTFKPRWDEQLSKSADPVYVGSRREERRLMDEMGVRPMESGDADAIRKGKIKRREEADAKLKKHVGDVCDKAFDKALAAF